MASFETAGKDAKADSKINVDLTELNFAYTGLQNTTLTLGKQSINTSFTDPRNPTGEEQTGTGIVATSQMGAITLTAGYFNQTNLMEYEFENEDSPYISIEDEEVTKKYTSLYSKGFEDIGYVSALTSFLGVNLDAAYMNFKNILNAYTLGMNASYSISNLTLSPYARYSSLKFDKNFAKEFGEELDEEISEKNSLWKAGVKLQKGIFGAHLGYGQTGSKGGIVSFSSGAPTGYDEHWNVTLSNKADASVIYASVNAQVLPSTNVSVNYSTLDDKSKDEDGKKNNKDEKEIYGQVTYDFSENFQGFVRIGQYKVDDKDSTEKIDQTLGRLQLQYSF